MICLIRMMKKTQFCYHAYQANHSYHALLLLEAKTFLPFQREIFQAVKNSPIGL